MQILQYTIFSVRNWGEKKATMFYIVGVLKKAYAV